MKTAANCCCSAVGMHRARWTNCGRRAARRRALFWQKERKRGGAGRGMQKTSGTGGGGLGFWHLLRRTTATEQPLRQTMHEIHHQVENQPPRGPERAFAMSSSAFDRIAAAEGGKRDIVRERARSERGACATATRTTVTATYTSATSAAEKATATTAAGLR